MERGGAGAGGGAGGIDVVDKQDIFSPDRRGPGDKKSAADIDAALMRAEARLTFGGALPLEQRGHKVDAYLRAPRAEGGKQTAGKQVRLIKSVLAAFLFEERNGDDPEVGGEVGNHQDLLGEQRSEALCQGFHPVIFEEVEEGAEGSGIDAVGYGFLKIGWLDAAGATALFGEQAGMGAAGIKRQGFAAAGAERGGLSGQIVPAGSTDGQEGKTRKRGAANAAVGGKKDCGETIESDGEGTSEHANDRAPCCNIGWRNFGRQGKALTEDTPHFGETGWAAPIGCSIRGKIRVGNHSGASGDCAGTLKARRWVGNRKRRGPLLGIRRNGVLRFSDYNCSCVNGAQ